MKKQTFILFVFFFLFELVTPLAFAAPVINEFSSADSSDWVEIYNTDDAAVDLSSFRIRDATANNKIDLSGTLNGKSLATFDFSNKLNNSGDVIKLVLTSDESVVDQTSYGDQGGMAAPSTNQSGGRQPDGSSNWTLFTSTSKGSSNNSAAIFTPPTSAPTKTPTPSKSPTPTKIPTVAKTSSSSTTQVSKTPTPRPASATANTLGSSTKTSSNKENSAKITQNFDIASDFARIRNVTKTPSKNLEKVAVLGENKRNFSGFFIIGGFVLLLSGAVLFARRYINFEDIYEKIFNK